MLDEAAGEAALRMVTDRNLASHTYNEDLAREVYRFAVGFLPRLEDLRARLSQP